MKQRQVKPAMLIEPGVIAQLARDSSIEMNVQDVPDLAASRELLPAGKKVYVSHLPKQTWQQTLHACRKVREAGFDPVPHVPVRLLTSERELDDLLKGAVSESGVQEVLLIAGDYPKAAGPYPAVADVLKQGKLTQHGLGRISLAGHPEGHPKVSLTEIRRAEHEKAQLAQDAGLQTTFLTQFFFEAQPFLDWSNDLRANGVQARLVAGLAGPASIATLFRYAVRCGVGPSIRALGARPSSLVKLIGDHGPERVIRDLASTTHNESFNGIHLFCFGGFLRTCAWLKRVSDGNFKLDDQRGFVV
ncbi:methylenetetrahydrofolate reductase [Steroidobacter sp. S1-65]|uniref:Methylenetetrahydrofolate reductase n=2 Tax=Steroidobacter gossypii TaxID=2805490 RepID=A0ABS1WYJ4_9GAMM|nr:methylenetetrahydrofolate reductase [Steroidobacter gossypii]